MGLSAFNRMRAIRKAEEALKAREALGAAPVAEAPAVETIAVEQSVSKARRKTDAEKLKRKKD